MLKFVLNTLIMFSLGAIIYLTARTLPRISDEDGAVRPLRQHWLTMQLEKIDIWVKARSEKMLRRLKIWTMKFDNWVSQRLNRFKKAEPKETIVPLEGENGGKNQNQV